jgi:hypothetical protein
MDDMISGYEWGDFCDIISVNELFTRLLLESGEASVPKFVKVHHKSYPSHILQIIKERQAIRKEKKGKSFEILKVLNSIYNKLTGLMRFKIKEYTEKKWSLFLGSLGPYPASSSIFWNIINRARSQKYSSSIPTLRIGDSVFESDEEKANLFASILGKTFSEDVNSTDFDNVIYSYVEDFVSKIDYSDENYDRCSLEELMSVLKNLRVDSAPGEDGLHNQFLKNLSPKGVILLLKLINLSWEVGLPPSWKIAIITMIPKKLAKSPDPNDYRGISLLSCVGKISERLIRNRLYTFLEERKLIVNEQSGFRNNRGTADNLVFLTQKIQECLNRGKKVLGIFFDASKAFDKVWHSGLIYKLIYMNVPMYIIRFVKDFLSGRTFKVKVNDKFSKEYPISCSVPQGSVLGPLLFLVFIGDIPVSGSQSISYSALFADDLGTLFFFNKQGYINKMVKNYLSKLDEWLFRWRMKMNPSKCNYTIFSGIGRGCLEFDLHINGGRIPYNPEPLFLGVTFDERLCFATHFANLRSRALKRLNIIKIFSHGSWHLNCTTLTNLYRALIGSIFDYSFFRRSLRFRYKSEPHPDRSK